MQSQYQKTSFTRFGIYSLLLAVLSFACAPTMLAINPARLLRESVISTAPSLSHLYVSCSTEGQIPHGPLTMTGCSADTSIFQGSFGKSSNMTDSCAFSPISGDSSEASKSKTGAGLAFWQKQGIQTRASSRTHAVRTYKSSESGILA